MRYTNLLIVLYFAAKSLSAAPNPAYVELQLAINAFWASNDAPDREPRRYGLGFLNTWDRANLWSNGLPPRAWCERRRFISYELDYLCSQTLQKLRNAIGQ